MDVVPDCGKDFLSEFVSSLDTSNEKPSEQITDKASDDAVEVNLSYLWSEIEGAFHGWMCKILDAESRLEKTASFRQNIEASLRRQQQDGFLNHQDIAELRHVADIWTDLMNCVSSYTVGCKFVKHGIIEGLLDLYTFRQISKSLFVEVCVKL